MISVGRIPGWPGVAIVFVLIVGATFLEYRSASRERALKPEDVSPEYKHQLHFIPEIFRSNQNFTCVETREQPRLKCIASNISENYWKGQLSAEIEALGCSLVEDNRGASNALVFNCADNLLKVGYLRKRQEVFFDIRVKVAK